MQERGQLPCPFPLTALTSYPPSASQVRGLTSECRGWYSFVQLTPPTALAAVVERLQPSRSGFVINTMHQPELALSEVIVQQCGRLEDASEGQASIVWRAKDVYLG